MPISFTFPFKWEVFSTIEKTWFMTGAWSWQEKQYLFKYSTRIKSALISLRENESPLIKPKNFWGSPRYSASFLAKVIGKEYSGKKSPGVMILPFSRVQAGMDEMAMTAAIINATRKFSDFFILPTPPLNPSFLPYKE